MGDSAPAGSVEYWRQLIEAAEKSGDHLGAIDAALLGLEMHPCCHTLQYRAVLNLSRAGAAKRAMQLWQKFGLLSNREGLPDPSRPEHIAALGARLHRELAFAARPEYRSTKLKEAALSYELIYRQTQGTFPGINAAVLYELSGDHGRAAEIASRIIGQCKSIIPQTEGDAYQLTADKATANLLLNELDSAQAAVIEAAGSATKASSIASTRKQLLQLCDYKGIDHSILSPLKNRSVLHYTGHMISAPGTQGRFPADAEAHVADQIRNALACRNVGYGYGSLARGADILIVEALLERTNKNGPAEVNVVLPFEVESFRCESLSQCDPIWLTRFDCCLKHATVSQATDGDYTGDSEVFAYASRLAMGLAVLRARQLYSDVAQLAVWDGQETNKLAGTWIDIQEWKSHGLETLVINSDGNLDATIEARESERPKFPPRKIRAILFGDFVGFSKLQDRQMLTFFEHLMVCVARTLDRFDGYIITRNTWGDGIYVVFEDLGAAARCALAVQSDLAQIDLTSLGLPPTLGLRLGLHSGAVYEIKDPVLKSVGFTGSHISRTARLEPNTPPGEVYVTETFAALLVLNRSAEFACEYVGLINTSKGYGPLRTYLLRSV
jgi:class 3 adenylate cyclase